MSAALHPACDAADVRARRDTGSDGAMVDHPRLVLATTILAFVDGSVVNVALPAIGESLGAGAASLQWIVKAYRLPLSALLLVGGALAVGAGRLDRWRVLEWVLA
jgi:MFS family permease